MLKTLFYAISIIIVFLGGLFLASTGVITIGNSANVTTINVVSLLNSVQSLSELTTTRYTYTLNLNVAREMPAWLAIAYGQQLTLQAVGHVNAGIDLNQMTEDSIQAQDGVLIVRLPPATLQDCFFNENASRVVAQRTAVFASAPQDLQVEARRIAIRYFRQNALDDDILSEASQQAARTIEAFLDLAVGDLYERIEVITSPPSTYADDDLSALPPSCGGMRATAPAGEGG